MTDIGGSWDIVGAPCTEQAILIVILSKFQISKHQDSGTSNIQIQKVLHGLCKFNRFYIKAKDARGPTVTILITAKVAPAPV